MNNRFFYLAIKPNIMNKGSLILAVFLILQPLLDLNFFFLNESLTVGGITFPTIVRYLFIIAFSFYFCILILNKSISLKLNTPGVILVGFVSMSLVFYVIAHIFYISADSVIYSLYKVSITQELSYLIRITVPIVFLFYFYIFEVKVHLSKIMTGWFILVPLFIVISNFAGFALSSYSNDLIRFTFFDWFKGHPEMSFINTGSKGFFRYANQVSMVLSMILPYFSVQFFRKKNLFGLFCLTILFLSMMMIGTKVSLYSFPILFFASFLCYVIYDILIPKRKLSIGVIISVISFILVFILIIPYTPSNLRESLTNEVINSALEQENLNTENEIPEESVDENHYHNMSPSIPSKLEIPLNDIYSEIDYLYNTKRIDPGFVTTTYSYNEDPDFWLLLLREPSSKLINNRFIEESILQRVKDLNNQPIDSLFGMGYSRMENLFPLEKDFISQFYTLGILGIILFFGVYLIPIALFLLIVFRGYFFKISLDLMISLVPVIYVIPIAITSGNILDSLLPTILLSFMISNTIHLYKKDTNKSLE